MSDAIDKRLKKWRSTANSPITDLANYAACVSALLEACAEVERMHRDRLMPDWRPPGPDLGWGREVTDG